MDLIASRFSRRLHRTRELQLFFLMSSFRTQLNKTGHECLQNTLSGEASCSACCSVSDKINPFEHSLIYWSTDDRDKCCSLGKIVAQATGRPTQFADNLIRQIAFCIGHNETNDHKRKAVKKVEPVVTMLITCDPTVAMDSTAWNPSEQGFVEPPSRWDVSINCPGITKSLINHLIRGTSTFEQLQNIANDSSSLAEQFYSMRVNSYIYVFKFNLYRILRTVRSG
jgi:hypothetical protein